MITPRLFFVAAQYDCAGNTVSGPHASIDEWIRTFGVTSFSELKADCRPVFVDRLPERYPEVMILRGSIVMPQAVTTVTEWKL